MSVTVVKTKKLEFKPTEEQMRLLAERAIAMIRRRTTEGFDINGAQFKPYTPAYAAARAEAGRSSGVNLTVTQALLRSVSVRSVVLGGKAHFWSRRQTYALIGPGTGPHPVYKLTRGRVKRASKKSKRRGAPINAIGYWLSVGRRARRWLGLAPKDRKTLAALAKRMAKEMIKLS